MRPTNDTKVSTHQRIIEAALEKFRAKGIDGTCLAEVMDDAAVKKGSFYYHFKSKEQLVLEVFVFSLKQAFDSWKSAVAEDGSGFGGELMRYLSISHRNNCAGGCALAALAPEMGRQSGATRTEIEKGLNQIFQMLNERLPIRRLQPCRTEAIAIYSMMIGALQLSRAVSSTEMSEEILRSGVEAALVVADRGIMESENFKSC
jgi:TetR/AcrR family transcriptional regulator, transcriptional repressor for nem operon